MPDSIPAHSCKHGSGDEQSSSSWLFIYYLHGKVNRQGRNRTGHTAHCKSSAIGCISRLTVFSSNQVFQGRLDSLAVATIKTLSTVMHKSPAAKVCNYKSPTYNKCTYFFIHHHSKVCFLSQVSCDLQ